MVAIKNICKKQPKFLTPDELYLLVGSFIFPNQKYFFDMRRFYKFIHRNNSSIHSSKKSFSISSYVCLPFFSPFIFNGFYNN